MGTLILKKGGLSWNLVPTSKDTQDCVYEYTHDSDVTSKEASIEVTNAAFAAGLPRRRERLTGTNLFVQNHKFVQNKDHNRMFDITVTFGPPEQLGPAMAAVANLHPIYHPVLNTVGYIEKEQPIYKAKNVEAITGGAARSAGTLGYIQNGAGVISENVPVEIIRLPILISRKNVDSLDGVLELNRPYSEGGYILTTNSDTVTIGVTDYPPRTLKFAGVDVGDQMEFDGIPYWQAERKIEIHKTTDWAIDSVGTQYCDASGNMVPILQYDDGGTETENEITEPIPIGLDGLAGTPGTNVTITYRYLDEVPYAPLVG